MLHKNCLALFKLREQAIDQHNLISLIFYKLFSNGSLIRTSSLAANNSASLILRILVCVDTSDSSWPEHCQKHKYAY